MNINKETRIKKIDEIHNESSIGSKKIKWKDESVYKGIYKIPLELLLYNKYNGRILSRTKSLESQGKNIDVETIEGKKLVEKLLWDSKIDRNKKTKENIEDEGQLSPGIITKDGIIIDGNRRAMLLNKINSEGKVINRDYFEAIILDVTLNQNPIEIEKLETSYQMGEDEKLGYNPIEKYLKSKNLYQKGVTIKQISDWMGESQNTVQEYLDVMEIMDEYLDYLGYNSIYTQLDGREDQFINLTKWLKTFYYNLEKGPSGKGFDGYKPNDVDNLKYISFDYIRVKYEGKEFRNIAYGQKQNHFFGNKVIWDSFMENHLNSIQQINEDEEKPNFESENLNATLNDRDTKYKDMVQQLLSDNLRDHITKIRNIQSKDEPIKLVNRAFDNISAINIRSKDFEKSDVLEKVQKLNEVTTNMLQKKSHKKALINIFNLLSSIEIDKNSENKEELLNEIKKINSLSFEIKKILGG